MKHDEDLLLPHLGENIKRVQLSITPRLEQILGTRAWSQCLWDMALIVSNEQADCFDEVGREIPHISKSARYIHATKIVDFIANHVPERIQE